MTTPNEIQNITPTTPQPIDYNQWSAHIPADMKEKGFWGNVKDQPLEVVLKNYGEAQTRLGKSIVLPEKEDKDGWNAVWGKLGRPESPDKYDYKLPEHEQLKWDPDTFKSFAAKAHELGAPNQVVSGLIDWFTKDVIAKNDNYANQFKETLAQTEGALKKEYGSNYDANIAFARRAAEMYLGADAGKDYVDKHMHEPAVVKGFVKLGLQLAEDGIFGKKPMEREGAISREAASKKIMEIMSDRSHAYWGNPGDAKTKDAQLEMENLHKIAYPE